MRHPDLEAPALRRGAAQGRAQLAQVLGAGDTLVLSGLPEPLALAEGKLLGRA